MSDFSFAVEIGVLPSPAEMVALYREADWWGDENDFESAKKMLSGSFAVATARSGNTVIGMMRAISDGVSDAYMLDLVVQKEFRRRGVGRALTEKLAEHLHRCGIEWIVLIGAPGTEKFYENCRNSKIMGDHTPWRFFEA